MPDTKILEDYTEQSYEVGRFLGIMRQMEKELHLLDPVKHNPGQVDKSLPYWITNPALALDECQITLIQAQKLVKEMGRAELLEDIRVVFELIDVPFLTTVTLHTDNFMKGYQDQQRVYH